MQTPMNAAPEAAAQASDYPMAGAFDANNAQVNTGGAGDGLLSGAASRKVLVVDDSLTERANLARIIQAAGYDVVTASSGNEAIMLAVEHEPVAIFLDIIMNDGDGYKACRTIRRNVSTATTPVIMVSSKANSVDQKWAERLGASSYVTKPYSDDDILQKLEMIGA